ncbi:MAG: acetolactate synthase [Myxococcales bacterium]|nr:acetolactate synthase [Myxococcales bacterium]
MSMIAGGHVVARALQDQGVTHLFTLCGGHIQNIYDGCLDYGIRVVDTRHEQSAAHAADGWARVTGEPGVAAVTAGPGVTDAVTAVANAQRAGVPMVLIGGAGPRALADKGSLQDMDHVSLMRSVTKWSVSVPEGRRLGEYVQSAFRIATSGVPGPVFLEMPLDLLLMPVSERMVERYPKSRTDARPAGDPDALDRVAELIRVAERPLIICGSQLRWSRDEGALRRFVQAVQAPVFVNGMARGALPREHPWLYGRCRREGLAAADLIIVFGTPLDFRVNYGAASVFNYKAKVVQIDLDGAEIGRNRSIDEGIVGDTGLVMNGLAERLKGFAPDRTEWKAHLDAAEEKKLAKMAAELNSDVAPPNPLRVCAELNRFIKPDTIVIGDGGDFVATAAYTLDVRRPGLWMDPGPLGTLGVGPGFAMAAKLARPECDVVLVYGDGSVGFNGFEFEAMVRQGIKVTAVVGNDACWTQIYRGQVEMFGEKRVVATKLAYTRYDKVVEALGGHGEYVEHPDQLHDAFARAFASPLPALVNVKLSSSDFRKGAISV